MALPSTIYRINLQIADIDKAVYENVQASVARHPSETEERLIARLLALAVFYEPQISFTKGLSAVDEPDLWVVGPDGRPLLWIEVGLPDAERIVKAARHAEKVALLAYGRLLAGWEKQQLPKIGKPLNLTLVTVEQSCINWLVARLERSIIWSVTITEGTLYLTVGTESFESRITCHFGEL